MKKVGRRWPVHGYAGILLVTLFWTLNWTLEGTRTSWCFFPLWLGYCLTVDAIVVVRKGNSILTRDLRSYLELFLISAPAWWLFEALNLRLGNWSYQGRELFSSFHYFLFASFSFSTVIPAVFSTAELFSTFGIFGKNRRGRKIETGRRATWIVFVSGWLMLALILLWPRNFFPLVWVSLLLIIEPVNILLDRPGLGRYLSRGEHGPAISLMAGCLVCGFFWEMWNYYSYPRWVYSIPHFDFLHIFEMPVLGYGGYLFFALELFALYTLVTWLPFLRGGAGPFAEEERSGGKGL